MGINFKEFMGDIKKGAGVVKDSYKNVVKNTYDAAADKVKKKKQLESVMKIYPSYTVTGEYLFEKRQKEFKKMIEAGDYAGAKKKAKELSDQFKKDNYPLYK